MILTKQDIEQLLNTLARKKSIFLCETQFQFELAWELQELFKDNSYIKVFLEFPCQTKIPMNNEIRRMYYDIVIYDKKDNEYCVIELKYKTKKEEVIYHNVKYNLKNHLAQDLGRYDFLNDIMRIEQFSKANDGKTLKIGYAILLTNDPVYWNRDGKSRKTGDCIYTMFELKEGSTTPAKKPLCWPDNIDEKSIGKYRNKPIELKKSFYHEWENYCNNFRYLLVEIKE